LRHNKLAVSMEEVSGKLDTWATLQEDLSPKWLTNSSYKNKKINQLPEIVVVYLRVTGCFFSWHKHEDFDDMNNYKSIKG